MSLKSLLASLFGYASGRLLPYLFQRSFFRASLQEYLVSSLSASAPRLFYDPLECIGSSILLSSSFYEAASINAIISFVSSLPPRPLLYIDVGANLGNHIVAFKDVYDYALGFEPVPFNYHLCRANVSYNQIDQRVAVYPLALGSRLGEITLKLPVDSPYLCGGRRNNGMFASVKVDPVHHELTPSNQFTCHACVETGDSYLQPLLDRYKRVVVKIDCEGAEVDVLRGFACSLAFSPDCEFILLLEILTSEALDCLFQFLDGLNPQMPVTFQTFVVDQNGAARLVSTRSEVVLPQSMFIVRIPSWA